MNDEELIKSLKVADQSVCGQVQIDTPNAIARALNLRRSRRITRKRVAALGVVALLCCVFWWAPSPSSDRLSDLSVASSTAIEQLPQVDLLPSVSNVAVAVVDSEDGLLHVLAKEDLRAMKLRLQEELEELRAVAYEHDQNLLREEVSRSLMDADLSWDLTF